MQLFNFVKIQQFTLNQTEPKKIVCVYFHAILVFHSDSSFPMINIISEHNGNLGLQQTKMCVVCRFRHGLYIIKHYSAVQIVGKGGGALKGSKA